MLSNELINFFYFPLKIMLVDDNEDYLNLCRTNFATNEVVASIDPISALKKINPIIIDNNAFISNYADNEMSINYSNIEKFVNQYKSLNQIGILITDYSMPKMNGLELCKKFHNTNLIKILLTGEYQIADAIEALNDKEIDYYVPKSYDAKILKAVHDTQNRFFKNITSSITNITKLKDIPSIFDDEYKAIFENIYNTYNMSTYYILNGYGCYFMSNEAENFVLSIYNKADILEIAAGYNFSDEVLSLINSNEFIPSCISLNNNKDIKLLKSNIFGKYFYHLEKITHNKWFTIIK